MTVFLWADLCWQSQSCTCCLASNGFLLLAITMDARPMCPCTSCSGSSLSWTSSSHLLLPKGLVIICSVKTPSPLGAVPFRCSWHWPGGAEDLHWPSWPMTGMWPFVILWTTWSSWGRGSAGSWWPHPGSWLPECSRTYLVHHALPFCMSQEISHLLCEIPPCWSWPVQILPDMNSWCMWQVWLPLAPLFCHCFLLHTNSTYCAPCPQMKGGGKPWSPALPTWTVVGMFYGAATFMYVLPSSLHSPKQDKYHFCLLHNCHPSPETLIYSLRNKEVMGAWGGSWENTYYRHISWTQLPSRCGSCCSVTHWCLTFCEPMDCSTLGFPVLRHFSQSLLKPMSFE